MHLKGVKNHISCPQNSSKPSTNFQIAIRNKKSASSHSIMYEYNTKHKNSKKQLKTLTTAYMALHLINFESKPPILKSQKNENKRNTYKVQKLQNRTQNPINRIHCFAYNQRRIKTPNTNSFQK